MQVQMLLLLVSAMAGSAGGSLRVQVRKAQLMMKHHVPSVCTAAQLLKIQTCCLPLLPASSWAALSYQALKPVRLSTAVHRVWQQF